MKSHLSMGRGSAAFAGAGVMLAAGLFPAAVGATNTATPLLLAPNHHVRTKPPGGGHGGGGGTTTITYGWASSNWSGYAETSNQPYTAITAQWTVPTVSRSQHPTYSAAWTGIDGFNNSDLIQTGTEQDFYNGSAHYSAWWTTSSNNFVEQPISTMTVRPSDTMTAKIVDDGDGNWTITLSDVSRGESFTATVAYSGPAASAEWIVEAPTVGGRVAPLANYANTTFDPSSIDLTTASNPGNTAFNDSDIGVLVQGRSIVSVPSLPDSDTDGFAMQYGSVQPAAPTS